MYSFNKILVALDNTDHDRELIEAASFIAHLSGATDVYFVNVVKDLNIPKSILKEFPDMIKNAIKDRKRRMGDLIKEHFTTEGVNTEIEIRKGSPTRVVLKCSVERDIDVILVGRKNSQKDGGTMVTRIARKAACSLLIIPVDYKKRVQKILVPIDFSNYSISAVKQALHLAVPNLPDVKLYIQNVFQVPNGYHYTGKSFDEFADIMRENAEKDYNAFMRDIDTMGVSVEPLYTLDTTDDIISKIYSVGLAEEVDAIVIGAKGRTDTTAIFIGSSAEKLIQIDSMIPIMVVRPKGRRAGLVELLKDI